ncbi:MAG: copper chaperone PCu(A)C [Ilumatobacteraceae bacterium]
MIGRRLAATALAIVAVTGCATDDPPRVTELTVQAAWARPTPAGATNGVVYLTVTSPTDDSIVGVTVPPSVAAGAELHETMGDGGESPMPNMPDMTTAGGEMTMTPLASVALPAGRAIAFEPGGKHIMLTDLVGQLLVGERFTLTLAFEEGASREVEVTVANGPPAD